jgi:hypothetical protein
MKNNLKYFLPKYLVIWYYYIIIACMNSENSTLVQSVKMSRELREHLKKVAKPNVNAWIVKTLKKASKYKES